MHLLADENFPKPVIEELRAEGHDVLWARTDHAGATDVVLLDLAEAEARIALTLDKDFGKSLFSVEVHWNSPWSFCSEFIRRRPRGWHRLYVRSSRPILRGQDISASSRSTEFKWSRPAEK
jgi:Domain of unknown function (DUF5615)